MENRNLSEEKVMFLGRAFGNGALQDAVAVTCTMLLLRGSSMPCAYQGERPLQVAGVTDEVTLGSAVK